MKCETRWYNTGKLRSTKRELAASKRKGKIKRVHNNEQHKATNEHEIKMEVLDSYGKLVYPDKSIWKT